MRRLRRAVYPQFLFAKKKIVKKDERARERTRDKSGRIKTTRAITRRNSDSDEPGRTRCNVALPFHVEDVALPRDYANCRINFAELVVGTLMPRVGDDVARRFKEVATTGRLSDI